jgi:hypothetical protein
MKKLLIVIVLLGLFVGCKNIEDLGPGNELALQNQTNLEKNVTRLLDNFQKLAEASPDYEEEKDQPIIDEQRKVILEQLVLNYAWLLVIKEAVEANALDPKFFGQVLDRAPAWIEEGKKIYDLIQEMSRKEE